MARWFTIGNEVTPVAADGVFFHFEGGYTATGTGTVTKNTSVKRSGGASRAHNSGATGGFAYTNPFWGLQGMDGYYARLYFRVTALPASTVRIMYFADNSTSLAGARLTSGGKIQLWNETGTPAQIGSDSTASVAVDTWYRLELLTKTVTGASDQCEVRLNGVTVASATLSLSDSMVSNMFYGWVNDPGADRTIYIDDVAINSDFGSTQNSWPGDGNIVYLDPVSDNGITGSWTAGAGATTSLFDAVDGDPPAGVAAASATNTSQIKNTNTGDATGNYTANLKSYTTAGLGATDTVTLVQAVMQVGTSAAATVAGAMHVVSNPAQASEDSKTMGSGAAIGSYASNWHSVWGTPQISPSVSLGTSPQIRIVRRGTQAAELHCCGMRLAVEYVPGTAAIAKSGTGIIGP